jgi:hypothetical protein
MELHLKSFDIKPKQNPKKNQTIICQSSIIMNLIFKSINLILYSALIIQISSYAFIAQSTILNVPLS